MTTLKAIEAKIGHIVSTFGPGAEFDMPVTAAPVGDDALLNGPQLPAMAMDQSDIDKLLASFD